MTDETLKRIEDILKNNDELTQAQKLELADLLLSLKNELKTLSGEHSESALSIVNFTQAIAHESSRKSKNPKLIQLSLDGLSSAVKEFEITHPELVVSINNFCLALSGMGI